MKHQVIHLADFLGRERELYLRHECASETLSNAIERYRDAIHTNIEKIGSPTFHELRIGIIELKNYYIRKKFLKRPVSWTQDEFGNMLQKCDFFDCQMLLFEIEQSLKHEDIRYLQSFKALFEAYRHLLRARKNELRYETFS